MESSSETMNAQQHIVASSSKNIGNFDSPMLQEFSLPKPIMRYITKNPITDNCYDKIVQTCKYFYSNFTIFAFRSLNFVAEDRWTVCVDLKCKNKHDFKLFDIPVKIWISKVLLICKKSNIYPNLCSTLIPKLYRCDITQLILYHQTLSLKEFSFLTPNVDYFAFIGGYIKEDDENVVPLEKIVENLPKLKELFFGFNFKESDISANTVKNLLQLNTVKGFKHFHLYEIPECFDFKTFSDFINKNKQISFHLHFRHFLSDNYKSQIQAYKDGLNNEKFEGVDLPEIILADDE